jgi:WD40 repeat protein
VVTTSDDGTAKIWDAGSGKELKTVVIGTTGVYSSMFSPNGRDIAIGGYVGELTIVRAQTGNKVSTQKAHNRAINTVAFSANGRYLVTASVDNSAKIWQVSNWSVQQNFRGGNAYHAAGFSPDGKYVVTGNDGVAIIWKVQNGNKVATLKHSSGPAAVRTVCFSPNGKYVVTAGEDNTTIIWELNLN